MRTHTRVAGSEPLRQNPVIAVLRANHAREYEPVIEALIRGGVRTIELTLSTQGVFELLPLLVARFAEEATIGVGTVTTQNQAERLLDDGAQFLVTPTMSLPVVAAAVARGVPVLPGGLTPTELLSGWEAGATAVKLFPASTVGPGYISQLHGPFPDIQIVPSGGVGIEDAAGWIKAGAVAVSIGGPLLQDAFHGGDLNHLSDRARRVSTIVADAVTSKESM